MSPIGKPRECALAFPSDKGALAFPTADDEVRVIGGMKLGYPDNHQVRFYFTPGGRQFYTRPRVGIRLLFPAKPVDYVSFSDTRGTMADYYSIAIKLPRDFPPRTPAENETLSVLRFTLKDAKVPQVENYGIPTVCEPKDQAIFDEDAKIDGVMSLRELCLQRRFELIVSNYGNKLGSINKKLEDHFGTEPKPVYPYANGTWNPARYEDELNKRESFRDLPYEPQYKFGSHEDCAVAISQGVVQDTYYFMKDVEYIRRQKMNKYGNTLARLLNGDAQFGLAFAPPPAEKESDRDYWVARQISAEPWKETGCDFAMKIRRPQRRDPGKYGDFYLKFSDYEEVARTRVNGVRTLWEQPPLTADPTNAARQYKLRLMNLYKADLFAGSGFSTLLFPPTPCTDLQGNEINTITQAMKDMSAEFERRSLPWVGIKPEGNDSNRLQDIIKEGIGADTFDRFCKYMKVTRLGVIPIIEFAEPEKTHMSVHVALLFIKAFGSLYCAAPTHVATSDFAERLFGLGTKVSKQLGWPVPLVVRSYRMKKKLDAFETMVLRRSSSHIADSYAATKSDIRLSPREWLLKTVGAPGYKLAENDPHALHKLHSKFQEDRRYNNLRLFLQGKSGSLWKQPEGASDSTEPATLAQELMEEIIVPADAVCTTPYFASQAPYSTFNMTKAKAVVLDEAGAMLEADALLVWGYGCRPCVLAGEELRPTLMSANETRNGHCVNVFSHQSRVSVLEKLRKNGWPCFVPSKQ
ncbi:hypothetical protein C8A03DRAFT_37707 [Achaetomium macrosporum]|uniref:DNA2/NAM7 helicase helicase domain-containing protein n=1 Tax=Achaetomium macrosporum TaxID=79813 RepID=A0AAN7H7T4_9PEZI|nr:hypothetical protein C8A03DRAFT_37707 [Achaetomium macrosporum]